MVLASLHRSNWDTMAVGVPLRHRRLRPMAKIELYGNPLMAWLLRRAGAFPVRRGQGDAEAVATALAILREGGLLAMFPEGTRNPSGKARPTPAPRAWPWPATPPSSPSRSPGPTTCACGRRASPASGWPTARRSGLTTWREPACDGRG